MISFIFRLDFTIVCQNRVLCGSSTRSGGEGVDCVISSRDLLIKVNGSAPTHAHIDTQSSLEMELNVAVATVLFLQCHAQELAGCVLPFRDRKKTSHFRHSLKHKSSANV